MSDKGTLDGEIVELSCADLFLDLAHSTDAEIAAHHAWLADVERRAAARNRTARRAHDHHLRLADRPVRLDDDGREHLPPPTSMLELVDAVLTAAPPATPAPIHTGVVT